MYMYMELWEDMCEGTREGVWGGVACMLFDVLDRLLVEERAAVLLHTMCTARGEREPQGPQRPPRVLPVTVDMQLRCRSVRCCGA